MDSQLLDLLRNDLEAADYTAGALAALWGSAAERSRHRGVLAPAMRMLGQQPGSALATLAKLFVLGAQVAEQDLAKAFPTLTPAGATALGLLTESDGDYRAMLSLNAVAVPDPRGAAPGDIAQWWIISDLDDYLRHGPARADHVMGVGQATRTLLAQTVFGHGITTSFANALDLGTGCGIVALYLARAGVPTVTATDISERALRFARANAHLNGLSEHIDFRAGDLFAPVADETFSLIVSNPPFVISPRGVADGENSEAPSALPARYEYRDAGMTGDALAQQVVLEAPKHLADGGTLIMLANWETPWGGDGLTRVRGWIADAEEECGDRLDAWVIERDSVDTAQYAETWARDGGTRPGDAEFDTLMESWLDDFESRHVVGVGLGSIRIARSRDDVQTGERGTRGIVRAEQSMGQLAVDRPGYALHRSFSAGVAAARMTDEEMLSSYWIKSERVIDERAHAPGEESPSSMSLVVDSPIGRRIDADTFITAAVGACDGDLTLGELAGALATVLEIPEADAAAALLEGVREFAWLGMLTPAGSIE